MADYSSLASDFDEAPAKASKRSNGYTDLASEFDAPTRPSKKAATFQTSDPASMRKQLASAGDSTGLAAFDKQYPAYAPQDNIGGGRGNTKASAYARTAPATQAPARDSKAPPLALPQGEDPYGAVVVNQLSGLGSSIVGGWKGLATLASGGSMEDASNAVTKFQQEHTYQPQPGTRSAAFVSGFGSGYNPLNWLGKVSEYAGEKTSDAVHYMGASPEVSAGAGTAVSTGLNALPYALGWGSRNNPVRPLATVINPGDAATITPQAPAARVEPTLENNPSPTITQDAQAPKMPGAAANDAALPPKAQTSAVANTGAAANDGAFPEVQPVSHSGTFDTAEQQRRASVLQSVGIDNARTSSLNGDHLSASTDHQTSLVDSPAGRIMRTALDNERTALSSSMDQAVERSGGTEFQEPMGQDALLHRGSTIAGAINTLRDWYDKRTGALYEEAAQRAQGVPTELDQFRTTLGDDSLVTNPSVATFRNAVEAKAKQLNIIRNDGSVFSDGQQAEVMRKYLNSVKDPSLFDIVGKLKSSLDQDVLSAAGEDIYGAARKLWAEKKNTLDNPDGISRIGSSSGPDGINRPVPIERIPSQVTGMPVAQLEHIVNTLKSAPDEMQPQAQAALNEIRAQFSNELREVGNKNATQWNARGVQQYLAKRSASLGLVFSPEEMGNFRNISDAGQILARPTQYPGAAAQGHNLARSGVMAAVQNGAAGVGSAAGSVFGAPGIAAGGAAGNYVGGKLAQKIGDAGMVKATQQRFTKLSDIVKPPER